MSDDQFAIDWDQAIKDAKEGFDPLPPGSYTVKVSKAEAVRAQSGSPMIKITLEVIEGPHKGRLVWSNLVLKPGSPGSAKMFAVKVMAFGLSGEYLAAQKPSMADTAAMLIGKTAVAEVEIREYQGRQSNDVKTLRQPKSGVPSAPSVGVPGPGVPTVGPPPVVPPTPAPSVPAPPTLASVDAPQPEPQAPAPEAEAPAEPQAPTPEAEEDPF